MNQTERKLLVLYVPGFGGNENSRTYTAIKANIPYESNCLHYENLNPTLARQQLEAQIQAFQEKGYIILLTGSSLGGYWANEMAQHFQLPCLLINPAISPRTTLPNGDRGHMPETVYDYQDTVVQPLKRFIFLGRQDEVIDPELTAKLYEGQAEISWHEEGHRFEDPTPFIEKLKQLAATILHEGNATFSNGI